ncbi:uncharacterized protein LOC127798945 [Diospyros lotus]|uniref:uncharacterized protein LOC127798945 n=1 Tax=Diospyros lotus TaxID=55363 RepID=UPI00224E674B|nr:uncharacterized protein LOC127798945 [Diospyros lotus]
METLSVGRLVLLLFFVTFVLFPKHPCGSHDDGGSMKKTKMMKWDHHEGGEKIHLEFCVKDKCTEGPCWCCRILGRTDCYGDLVDCEAHCPTFPPADPSALIN